jgi:hypothetical protein
VLLYNIQHKAIKYKIHQTSAPLLIIRVGPPGYFILIHISITTPIASKTIILYLELPGSPNGFLKALPDPGGGFRIETAVTKPFRK